MLRQSPLKLLWSVGFVRLKPKGTKRRLRHTLTSDIVETHTVAAIIQDSRPAAPDEVMHLLDQLYILGVAGGLILQMVAVLQANQRAELPPNVTEDARSSYNSLVRQRLDDALSNCDNALYALMKLTRVRTA
jgi:hypothetical protein